LKYLPWTSQKERKEERKEERKKERKKESDIKKERKN